MGMEQIVGKLRKFVGTHAFGGMGMMEDYNEIVQLLWEYERNHESKKEAKK